jgi:hypothetical protein
MQENPSAAAPAPSSFLGTPGEATQSEQYRGTLPMQIPAPSYDRNRGALVAAGVDVGHMGLKPDPVASPMIARAPAGSTNAFGDANEEKPAVDSNKTVNPGESSNETAPCGSKGMEQTANIKTSFSDVTSQRSARPLLDGSISRDCMVGSEKKRKWWRMP